MQAVQPPAWTSLGVEGGPHLKALNRDYVPAGLLELVPAPPETVLDVGCFCGAVGAWLKRRYPGSRVVGVEPLEDAARQARGRLDTVLVGKLEEVDLANAGLRPGGVDVIVLADVLEHMYDPWHALLALRPLLKPDGVVLASIPNIRNLTVLEQLASGDFDYADSGLLDITHIRFFTRRGMQRLFNETGYVIDTTIHNLDPQCQQLLGNLPGPLRVNVDTRSLQLKNQDPEQVTELATLQFGVRARPS